MDTTVLAAIGGGVVTILGNQWVLHLQNRKEARKLKEEELTRDNKLAFLLENFPPHLHQAHEGITYPAGLDPRRMQH
jgi:hypothetical protein